MLLLLCPAACLQAEWAQRTTCSLATCEQPSISPLISHRIPLRTEGRRCREDLMKTVWMDKLALKCTFQITMLLFIAGCWITCCYITDVFAGFLFMFVTDFKVRLTVTMSISRTIIIRITNYSTCTTYVCNDTPVGLAGAVVHAENADSRSEFFLGARRAAKRFFPTSHNLAIINNQSLETTARLLSHHSHVIKVLLKKLT